MDLDNFEFRPLTDGLGFDKTADEVKRPARALSAPLIDRGLKKQPPRAVEKLALDPTVFKKDFELEDKDFVLPNKAPVSRSLKKMLDSLPPSVDFREDSRRELKMRAPLIPEKRIQTPVYRPTPETAPTPLIRNDFDVTLNNSLSQAFPKEEVSKRFYHQMVAPIPKFKEESASFASAIIDILIVVGLSSLFIVSLVAITKVDILRMLTSQQMGTRTMIEIGLLYAGVALFYFMISRGMFGSTLGDWAFDVQLGTEQERAHLMYPFQVLFRTLVILLTGVILVPLASLGFGKDIAYYFSGLKLYSRQY